MRRFELVDDASSKFWEIQLEGLDVTVCFGRIGTQGQAKTKTFASAAAALKEHDKLVKEKTGKGYAEVAVQEGARLAARPADAPAPASASTPAAASAPASAPLPASATATASAPSSAPSSASPSAPVAAPAAATAVSASQMPTSAPVSANAPPPGPACAASDLATPSAAPTTPAVAPLAAEPALSPAAPLREITGGFRWTDEWRALLPVVRGVRVPPRLDPQPLLDRPLLLPGEVGGLYEGEIRVLNKHAQASWSYWGTERSMALIRREVLASADTDFWVDLCVQMMVAQYTPPADRKPESSTSSYRYGLHWAAEVGAHLRGLPFITGVLLALAPRIVGTAFWGRTLESMLPPLRHAIAAAGDAKHAELLAALESGAGESPLQRLLRAALCPHHAAWVLQALDDALEDRHFLLTETVMPPQRAAAYLRQRSTYAHRLVPTALLQIQLNGEQALPLLVDQVRRAVEIDDSRRQFTSVLAAMHYPALPRLLIQLMGYKEVRTELERLAESHPAPVLKAAIDLAHEEDSRLIEGWALQLAMRVPGAQASALQAASPAARQRFEARLALLRVSEAPTAALPPLLRDPPWLRKARNKPLPTLEVALPTGPGRLTWTHAERQYYVDFYASRWRPPLAEGMSETDYAFDKLGIQPGARERVLAGEPLRAEDLGPYKAQLFPLMLLPDAAMLAVWNSLPAQHWYLGYGKPDVISAVLARHGAAALPAFARFVAAYPEIGLDMASIADCPLITPVALNTLHRLKRARPLAMAWLRAHAGTALPAALAQAFGKFSKTERDDAQFGLRWYLANGFEDQARAAADAHSPAMAQALQALADADPLLVLPTRMPALPAFFVAPALPRPMLRDGGGALPQQAVEHLGLMLAISDLEAPYGGLAIVRETCTPESLASFAWALFQAWLDAGAAPKEAWAFRALGLLGDDDSARRLTLLLREWPSEGQHQRAVNGLDVLAAIGSDMALMHLHGIASKSKAKPLQLKAQEKIAAVAEARGFSADELADRLVPDLGLDEAGTLRLDFGPRAFTVAFDESLKPFVRDEQGARLKDLPKPIKTDDAALAESATERFKRIKKDAKAIASLQVLRLERAMIQRRRWTATEFKLFFIEHPLMRHLAARLVWGVYAADGAMDTAFRVAEDFSFADAEDSTFNLAPDVSVGIAHVLEMPQPLQAAFSQIFADYEILQPFRQLGRETYTLTEAEKEATQITRYADKTVATGSVLGLAERGWDRGQEDGWIGWFSRRVGDGLEASIELDPGTHVGDPAGTPKQRVPTITLRQTGTWGSTGHVPFGRLHPVAASEVLRAVDLLAPIKG